MDRLQDLEANLHIDEHCYDFERNENGSVSHIEFFDPEYWEFPAIESNILEALSNYTELESITINIHNYVLKDISNLRNFKKLKSFDIEDGLCDIDDLSLFSELKDLEFINFYGPKITDLSPLKYLSKLKSIVIYGSCIEDIKPLSTLESLEILSLNQANIKDITPIADLKNLKSLALDKNEISDISILAIHPNLIHLYLSANKIEDISALKPLNNLTNIGLSHNKIKDTSALKEKKNLNYLDIQHNQISDISFLNDCIKLNWLIISDNPIQDIKPVTKLTELRTFQANNIKTDDLGNDKFQSELHWLSLSNCSIENIQFLENQKNLQSLNLSNNKISDISVLLNFYQLKYLSLKNNEIEKPLPISITFLNDLQELDLRGNLFSGKFYSKNNYGYSSLEDKVDEYFSAKEYEKDAGEYFFEHQQYDEALAIYYYNRLDIESLEIYINKFTATSKNDLFHLRYYFSKIVNIHALRKAEDSERLRKIVRELHYKINDLNYAEKELFRERIANFKFYSSFDLFGSYMAYINYDEHPENIDAEVYHALTSDIQRDNLMEILYYLKKLKELKSPFYYKLYGSVNERVRSSFSGTERNKYMELLTNIENADIPIPDIEKTDNKYKSFHNLDYSFNKETSRVSREERSILGKIWEYFLILVMIICFIVAIYYFIRIFN